MGGVWLQSAVWLGRALAASIIPIWIALSAALVEIVTDALAGNAIGPYLTGRVSALAGFGAILLTCPTATEFDLEVVRGPSSRR